MSSLALVSPRDPEEEALEQRSLDLSTRASAIVIVDQRTYAAACEVLVDVKTMLGAIDDLCDPSIEAAHRAHTAALAVKKKLAAPLLAAEKTVKPRIAAYVEAEALARKQEETRRAEEAKKRQEEERLLEAIDLEAAGESEAAAEVLSAPVVAPIVSLPPPKADGVSVSKKWSAVVVDMKALARAVADGVVPVEALLPNAAFLNGMARAMKSAMNVPGVRAQSETTVSGSRR